MEQLIVTRSPAAHYSSSPSTPLPLKPQSPIITPTMPSSSSASLLAAYYAAEYLLRDRSLPSSLANSLLLSLPPLPSSTPSPRSLRRLIYLRSLSSSPLSLNTLLSVEMLFYLNPDVGSPNPMAAEAYLTLAVYLTVSAADFARAVEIMFKQRVGDVMRCEEAGGLVSERMKEVKTEMEKAIDDLEVRERVLKMEGLMDVEAVLREFVEKEWEMVYKGKCFVEMAVDVAQGVEKDETVWIEAVERERHVLASIEEAEHQENQDHQIHSTRTSTPEADKIQNRLKSNIADLKQCAPDPLPEAIEKANEAQIKAQEIKDKGKKVICEEEEGASKKGGNRSSIMDRNPTAVTYEWNDSIESDSDKSKEKTKKRRLPSLKPMAPISPLRAVYNNQKVSNRRKPKKWTIIEEQTLIKGVNEHGKGNWKLILNSYPDVFEERTEVDLKDKWRNMHKD